MAKSALKKQKSQTKCKTKASSIINFNIKNKKIKGVQKEKQKKKN
jgi:hypothetical protein